MAEKKKKETGEKRTRPASKKKGSAATRATSDTGKKKGRRPAQVESGAEKGAQSFGNRYVDTLYEELQKSEPAPESGGVSGGGSSGIQGLAGDLPIKKAAEYFDRMRGRLLFTLVFLMVATVGGFFVSDYVLRVVTMPFVESGQKLNIFTVTGGFMIRLKASFGASLLLTFPLLVWQIWRSVSPAIPKASRMFSRLSLLAAVALFYAGIAFVYFLLMPAAVKILLNFVGSTMDSTIGADDYLSFTILFSFSMGILFDTPIIVMILTYIGIVGPELLRKHRKYAIVIMWIIAAIITPTPDPLNQTLVAVPLMLFYEISILASKLVVKRKKKALIG